MRRCRGRGELSKRVAPGARLDMTKDQRKAIRKAAIAVVILGVGFYFIPIITLIWLVCGLIDVLRNKKKDQRLFSLYFTGNGMFTWLLSPFNLLVDLISYKNWGVWKLEQFPADYQRERFQGAPQRDHR